MAQQQMKIIVGNEPKRVRGNHQADVVLSAVKVLEGAGMIDPNLFRKKDVPTVKEFVENTYKPSYFPAIRASTAANYNRYLKDNIYPFLGNMRLDEVTVVTVQNFRAWMANGAAYGRKNNLNESSINRITGFAGRIFKVALGLHIIDETPFQTVLLPKIGEKAGHHEALSDEDVAKLKQGIPKLDTPREQLLMGLLAYSGMRPEEALGLRWEDLNIDRQYGLIKRAVTYPDNNLPCIDKTKTESSARTILLPTPLIDILNRHKQKQGYIISGKDNETPCTYTVRRKIFNHARKQLHIEHFSAYDLRTTFGTQMCEQGVPSKICADLMGHADTRMVETVYARRRHEGIMKQLHLLEEMNKIYTTNQSP